MTTITLRLHEIGAHLGKNISDIAQETGLNRNTVSALWNNQVEGITFDTLQLLCDTYKVSLEGLFAVEKEAASNKTMMKQARLIVPFNTWMWFLIIDDLPVKFFGDHGFGTTYAYFKKGSGYFFRDVEKEAALAWYVVNRYKSEEDFAPLEKAMRQKAKRIEDLYYAVYDGALDDMDADALRDYMQAIIQECLDYARHFSFLHAIDAVVEIEETARLQRVHGFTHEEVMFLSSPDTFSFNQEKFLEEIDIVKTLQRKMIHGASAETVVDTWMRESKRYQEYKREVYYYQFNYGGGAVFSDAMYRQQFLEYLAEKEFFFDQAKRYEKAKEKRAKQEAKILKRHGLRENPFFLFSKMNAYRELRKKHNFMTASILEAFLGKLEEKTGFDETYLHYLSYDEIDHIFKGLVSEQTLKARHDNGFFLVSASGTYRVVQGAEADALEADIDARLIDRDASAVFGAKTLSLGYARGILCTDPNEKKKKGKILLVDEVGDWKENDLFEAMGIVFTKNISDCLEKKLKAAALPALCLADAGCLMKAGDVVEIRANHETVRVVLRDED